MQGKNKINPYLIAKEKFPVGSIIDLSMLIRFDNTCNIFGRIKEISKDAKIDVELGALSLKESTSRTKTEPNPSQDHSWESDTIQYELITYFFDPKQFKPFSKNNIYDLGSRHKYSTRRHFTEGLDYIFKMYSKDTKLHYFHYLGYIWLPERALFDLGFKEDYKLKLVKQNLEGLVIKTTCD